MRILITGATDGIGKSTARELAARGHELVVHGRPGEKAQQTLEDLRHQYGDSKIKLVTADLSVLSEVDALCDRVIESFPDLDSLILNAGVITQQRKESADGYELNLAVNHLAHSLLTIRLTDLLAQNSPTRIVVVSSMVHEYNKINWADLNWEQSFDPHGAYGQSKVANIMMMRALTDALWERDITINALHPGVIDTKLLHVLYGGGAPVEVGSRTSVYLATSPEVAHVTGRYFSERRQRHSWVLESSEEESLKLWRWTVDQLQQQVNLSVPELLSGV